MERNDRESLILVYPSILSYLLGRLFREKNFQGFCGRSNFSVSSSRDFEKQGRKKEGNFTLFLPLEKNLNSFYVEPCFPFVKLLEKFVATLSPFPDSVITNLRFLDEYNNFQMHVTSVQILEKSCLHLPLKDLHHQIPMKHLKIFYLFLNN